MGKKIKRETYNNNNNLSVPRELSGWCEPLRSCDNLFNSPFHDGWDSKFARSTGSYPFLNDVEVPEDARTPRVYPEREET